jgi:alpha,alpha-trehalase
MARAAKNRRDLLLTYCWNKDSGYFYDYNFVEQRQTGRASLAGIYPLFFHMVDSQIAKISLKKLELRFLCKGGLVTSLANTGQQWDFPNGWAPLQWLGYKASKNYGDDLLAREIAIRWTNLNCKVFFGTGKMLEKYNVVDIYVPGGGGEYPLQDGFGWTNGVFLKLWMEERKNSGVPN